MNRPTTEPAFNPYTDEVEDLPPPTPPPIDDNPPNNLDAGKNEDFDDLEITLSAHEMIEDPSYAERFVEEYLSSSSSEGKVRSSSSWQQRRNAMIRKGALISIAVVMLIVVGSVAIASSLSKRNRDATATTGTGLQVSEAISAPEASIVTGAPAMPEIDLILPSAATIAPPVSAPVAVPVKAPVADLAETSAAPVAPPVASPVASPVSSPVSQENHSVPVAGHLCTIDLTTDKDCYVQGETVQISFTTCGPGPHDWVGLFPEGADTHGRLQSNFLYWEYTCGKTEGYCDSPPRHGTLSIPARVAIGSEYQFYLVFGENPDMAMASTAPFLVSDSCHNGEAKDEVAGEETVEEVEEGEDEWMDEDEVGSN